MKLRSCVILSAVIAAAVVFSGCSGLMGGLRQDLDDTDAAAPPTTGGSWTERGLLDDENGAPSQTARSGAVGHSERAPSATGSSDGSWVTPDQAAENGRDQRRDSGAAAAGDDDDDGGGNAYSQNPNMPPPSGARRATRADFVDASPNEGSLWGSDGQTNYYFTKNKVRSVGDIVTLVAGAAFSHDMAGEIARTLSSKERDQELDSAQDRIDNASSASSSGAAGGGASDSVQSSSAAPTRPTQGYNSEPGGQESRKASTADIDLTKSIGFKAGDTIMAEIVERYPNGNYKVRGTKRVTYKNSPRLVSVLAIARATDIADDDTIPTEKLYEYRLDATR